MRKSRMGVVFGAALLLSVAACGGGDATVADSPSAPADSVSAPADSMSPAATASAAVDTDQGCLVAEKTGSTDNQALQAFTDSLFESIDCSSGTDLTEQLPALADDADFKTQVADQGWTAEVTEAAGAVVMSITDLESLSLCKITVLDSPGPAKSMDCVDA